MNLTGRSILIAGGTGGIGSRIARTLIERGAAITTASRRSTGSGLAGSAHAPGDLRLPGNAEAAVEAAIRAHGRLDGLVNAAGVVAFGNAADESPDVVEELFLTNTLLPIFLIGAAVPRMEDGGVIVNVSGVVAERAVAGMAAYSASKAALRFHGMALRTELRRRGIRVIDARPGHTETGLATRPIAGSAPRFPTGHAPDDVARRIVAAIEADEDDLGPDAF
jgi:cyclic-di-GMP-binding biofilm dispersal mediator protein